jgi:hypothetical protein
MPPTPMVGVVGGSPPGGGSSGGSSPFSPDPSPQAIRQHRTCLLRGLRISGTCVYLLTNPSFCARCGLIFTPDCELSSFFTSGRCEELVCLGNGRSRYKHHRSLLSQHQKPSTPPPLRVRFSASSRPLPRGPDAEWPYKFLA